MPLWHHDVILQDQHGQNYAIVFSVRDWLFGTAYYPDDKEQPEALGFENLNNFPSSLLGRIFYPLSNLNLFSRKDAETQRKDSYE